MFSVLFSKLSVFGKQVSEDLKKIINPNMKLAIIPWTFNEDKKNIIKEEFFYKGSKYYERNINVLLSFGFLEKNITILDCFNHSKSFLKKTIKNSDAIFIPGGNPEMLMTKIISTEIITLLKNFKGILIGESAGSCIQFERYFITSFNNYFKCMSIYNGFASIKNNFYIDVHTTDEIKYQEELQNISNLKNTTIYAIYDEGCIIHNRKTNENKFLGKVKTIKPSI